MASYYIKHFNTFSDLLYFSMMENDATLTGLIAEVTDKIQNIKLSTIKQSNIVRFFEVLNNES